MENSKYNHLQFIIQRFDQYFDAINNKGSFYIGLNTFILTGLCAGYFAIENKIEHSFIFWAQFFMLFFLCLASIFFTISAISPFLRDNECMDDIPSLIYFGGIAKFNQNTFISKLKNYTDELIEEDMFRQVHCLASALKRKFAKLKVVSFLLLAQFSVIIIFTIYIIKQIK